METTRLRALQRNEESARLSDVARLATELQRSAPGSTRTECLLEADRLQREHGQGLTVAARRS